jgi:hypothetical protein
VGDVLAREDVLDGLVLEDAATRLGDRKGGELTVLVEGCDRGLLHQVVDALLGERSVGLDRLHGIGDQGVDRTDDVVAPRCRGGMAGSAAWMVFALIGVLPRGGGPRGAPRLRFQQRR